MTEITIYNVERAVTIYNIQSAKQVFRGHTGHKYMTEITVDSVPRAVTAKVDKQELWFLCITCRLMVVNISTKFD